MNTTSNSVDARIPFRMRLARMTSGRIPRMIANFFFNECSFLEKSEVRQRRRPDSLEPRFLGADQIGVVPRRHENVVGRMLLQFIGKYDRRVRAWHQLAGAERRRLYHTAAVRLGGGGDA